MKQILILLLALSAWQLNQATGIESVRSSDTSKTSNTVSIDLSDSAQYSVEKLSGGKGVRLIIKDVKSLGGNPSYPRLSEVIDVVSTRMEGGNAIIDIKTMGDYNISHQASSGNSRITVSINSGAAVPPKSVTTQVETPKTVIPPGAMPRKVNQPDLISSRPVPSFPKPVPAPPKARTPAVEKPLTQSAIPPEPPLMETPLEKPQPQPTEDFTQETEDADPIDLKTDRSLPVKSKLPLYLILAAAALLSFWVILKFLARKNPPSEAAQAPQKEPSIEGTTLLLDPETRRRMVQKLLDQGWSTSEIAREIRLDMKDVERLVAELKGRK